ncbi:MAG: prolipoprotein diacylglyceryl transferase [Thermodesulfobacteriota bacterium]|nr:prolipoprotein diacylglyceryl transferase [Thermodesulfobacteriota bacterium]
MFDITILWNYSPYIFSSDFISIRYYSLFFAIGVIFVYIKTTLKASSYLTPKKVDEILIPCILCMLLFSRVFHCLFYEFSYYSNNLLEILLPIRFSPFEFTGYQGLSSHGGFVGFLFCYFIFYRKKIKFNISLKLLDAVFYYSIVLISLIRVGNLFNSEILGKVCSKGLCVIFPLIDAVSRHPVQFYEAVSYVFIYLILRFFSIRIESVPGRLMVLSVFSVSLARFLLEFLKETQTDIQLSYFNMGQLLTLPIMLISLLILLILNGTGKKYRKEKNMLSFS